MPIVLYFSPLYQPPSSLWSLILGEAQLGSMTSDGQVTKLSEMTWGWHLIDSLEAGSNHVLGSHGSLIFAHFPVLPSGS